MDEEIKYRVEEEEESSKQETRQGSGFLKPLPQPESSSMKVKRGKPITTLLGQTMYEDTRDKIVLLVVPLFVALIDANLYGLVIIDVLADSVIYLFLLPAIAAVPIGLTAGKTSHAMFGALICTIFFMIFLELFFITPALMAPDAPFGEFVLAGIYLNFAYMLFVVFASLVGGLIGALIREFA